MNSQQKNSMNLSKLKEVVSSSTNYTLPAKIKNDLELREFVLSETSNFPEKINLSFRAKAVAEGNPCECLYCGRVHGRPDKKFCKQSCYTTHKSESKRTFTFEQILEYIPSLKNIPKSDRTDLNAFQPTNINGFVGSFNEIYNMTESDLSNLFDTYTGRRQNKIRKLLGFLVRIAYHNKEITDYTNHVIKCDNSPHQSENLEYFSLLYGEEYAKEKLKKKSERVAGKKNPGFQHGGKLSPFSENFVGYDDMTDEERRKEIEALYTQTKATKKSNPEKSPTHIEFYLARGMSEDEAKQALRERQTTFTKEKLIEKYGDEEGLRVWNNRQEKWMESMNSLPESEKIRIRAKKGFWRHTSPKTDEMNLHDEEFNNMKTKLYVIEYRPIGWDKTFVKVGVTSKYLKQRFPSVSIKEEIMIHESDRFTNFHIERDVKKYMFENKLTILLESEKDAFDGWTECVELKHKEELLKVVNEAIRSNKPEV